MGTSWWCVELWISSETLFRRSCSAGHTHVSAWDVEPASRDLFLTAGEEGSVSGDGTYGTAACVRARLDNMSASTVC